MAQKSDILLITPPFTQLNTPYPATAYLKGYLNQMGKSAHQCDLGIEVILKIFSKKGLSQVFDKVESGNFKLDDGSRRMLTLKDQYLACINPTIRFLQNKNSTLAYAIAEGEFLPEGARFAQLDDLEWAFGTLGIQDKARHLATLFLEDISDLIQNTIDPFFGFSRYAERISLSAESFDDLYTALSAPTTFVDDVLIASLKEQVETCQPSLIGLSIPFPGNLYAALRCGQYIKKHFPEIKISLGGGYANTELRSVKDTRLFEFIDYITLDDGEKPVELLIDHVIKGTSELKRTLHVKDDKVAQSNNSKQKDVPFAETGTPDYEGLPIDKYLSVIELTNPMHRLWSDGRWNKLTMAHGCYWKQCTFCDISLDYIKNYDPVNANIICDRIEALIEQTGETGFHFVDEAAPPALMRDVALEILKRNLKISWWTNIRFEKRFSADLCRLLKASGCIAVSGGLEVASDRLLELIKKGVTVEQVARVSDNFTQAGIMVHAYLMYGFPTQTAQETIDSLEMVRQMFELGIVQSGYWHQFAMTAHSPVGMNPDQFQVKSLSPAHPEFAHNDLQHEDPTGADHDLFSDGLRISLYNYMHGVGLEMPLQDWFEHEVPETTVSPYFIEMAIQKKADESNKNTSRLVWLANAPRFRSSTKMKKGKIVDLTEMMFSNISSDQSLHLNTNNAYWVQQLFELLNHQDSVTLGEVQEIYHEHNKNDKPLMDNPAWKELLRSGLLIV